MTDQLSNARREPLHGLLDHAAEQAADTLAIVSDDRTVTYGELAVESRRIATWFHDQGVGRGDRVAVLLRNRVETVAAMFAASRLGAVFVVLNSGTRPFQLEHILGDAAPALLLTDEGQALPPGTAERTRVVTLADYERAARADAPDPPRFPGITTDPVCLIYTSGSTSKPKGVISTHANVRFAAAAIGLRLGVVASDVIGTFLPLSFDYGMYQVFLAMQACATLALGHDGHVGPGLLNRLRDWHVTALPLVPSIAQAVIRLTRRAPDQELPKLRLITNTGARLSPPQIDELHGVFPACEVFPMFGLTECKRVSILDPSDYPRRPTSVGQPLPDTECLIVDAEGRPLPPGEAGELVVRGPHVMAGYWNAPELTDKRFRPWGAGTERALFSGDRCSMDADGYLYFHGRDDDIYKSRGYRVSALEVEDAAASIDGVDEAGLVPPSDGASPHLFVSGSCTPDAVVEGLRDRLEEHKVPEAVLHLDELPHNVNGKVDKQRLRDLVQEQA